MIRPGHFLCAYALSGGLIALAGGTAPNEPAPPATPREFYNAGTLKLREGKLREAEPLLESALASQQESLQPVALYNLGLVRFSQGAEELKKGPPGRPTLAAGQAASQRTDQAIRSAAEALAADDLHKMVEAYRRGRGQRRELKAAMAAVRRALEAHQATLNKWQRAGGDFRSAVELNRTEADARYNAAVVDQWIAKLVDTLRELQQLAQAMADQKRDLGDKMKQLKGKVPAPDMPPGATGDDEDEEEEDQPKGPQPGQQEGPSREGEELMVSPEQAGWLLEGFRLDAQRRLPMGQTQQEPRNRNRPTW
ncbi:MAG TPA: hypothetical protein VN829_09985 [Dongiaceae bacterium]|nr:hypothetical protein [Dongiaceae bacterium]